MIKNYIGIVGDKKIEISRMSMNTHVLITGMSGSGKSVRMTDIEMESVREGKTVIVLDKDGTHYNIPENYKNVISVLADGLDLRLLDSIRNAENMEEKMVQVMYVADILASGQNLGDRQICCLRTAVEYAAEHKDKDATEMYTISRCLEEQKGNSAEESEQEYLLQLRLLQLPMHLRTLQACLCGLNFLLIVRLKNCVPYNRMDKPLHSTRYRKWRSMPSVPPGLHSPVSGITRQLLL